MNGSGSTLVAALLVSGALLGSAFLLKGSLDRTTGEVAGLKGSIEKLEQLAARPAAPAAGQGRPDPSRRYTVSTTDAPSKGKADAKIVLVEFSDFQCPFCSRVTPTLTEILEKHGDDVRIVFKHLPLAMHAKAPAAHAAAEAAHLQGKFWEMHDLIFANQAQMSPEKYVEYAKQIGLDVERFQRDVASEEVKKKVAADSAEAARLGVTGTPAFFVNGRYLSGAQPYAAFEALIVEEREKG